MCLLIPPHHHFCFHKRVLVSLPCIPNHASSKRRVSSIQIQSVQVGRVTLIIPPSPFIHSSTIILIRIVVVILCAELLSVMILQTVSYNTIKMEHYFCGERFPVVPRLTVYYHKIKMEYYYCYLSW